MNEDGAGRSARRRPRGPRAMVACLLGAALLAVGACESGRSSPQPMPATLSRSSDSYGSLPSFLPSSAIRPDSVLTGNAQRPALTTEGDSVEVQLAHASVRASVNGPVVPGEGLPYRTPATTCTWTVTLSGATANVPVDVADFTTLDHLGTVYHLGTVPGKPNPPTTLTPGQTATFELRTVMPTGEGLLRWAPGGQQIVASWDFEVEND